MRLEGNLLDEAPGFDGTDNDLYDHIGFQGHAVEFDIKPCIVVSLALEMIPELFSFLVDRLGIIAGLFKGQIVFGGGSDGTPFQWCLEHDMQGFWDVASNGDASASDDDGVSIGGKSTDHLGNGGPDLEI